MDGDVGSPLAPLVKFCELLAQIRPRRALELLKQVKPANSDERMSWLTAAARLAKWTGSAPSADAEICKVSQDLTYRPKSDEMARCFCESHPEILSSDKKRNDAPCGRLVAGVWFSCAADVHLWTESCAATSIHLPRSHLILLLRRWVILLKRFCEL